MAFRPPIKFACHYCNTKVSNPIHFITYGTLFASKITQHTVIVCSNCVGQPMDWLKIGGVSGCVLCAKRPVLYTYLVAGVILVCGEVCKRIASHVYTRMPIIHVMNEQVQEPRIQGPDEHTPLISILDCIHCGKRPEVSNRYVAASPVPNLCVNGTLEKTPQALIEYKLCKTCPKLPRALGLCSGCCKRGNAMSSHKLESTYIYMCSDWSSGHYISSPKVQDLYKGRLCKLCGITRPRDAYSIITKGVKIDGIVQQQHVYVCPCNKNPLEGMTCVWCGEKGKGSFDKVNMTYHCWPEPSDICLLLMEKEHAWNSSHCTVCGCFMKRILRCGLCRHTSYCSVACQKKDWPEHRKSCGQKLPSMQPLLDVKADIPPV